MRRQSGVTALTVNNSKLRAPAPSRRSSTSANAPSSPQQQGGEEEKACPNPLFLHFDVYGK